MEETSIRNKTSSHENLLRNNVSDDCLSASTEAKNTNIGRLLCENIYVNVISI